MVIDGNEKSISIAQQESAANENLFRRDSPGSGLLLMEKMSR